MLAISPGHFAFGDVTVGSSRTSAGFKVTNIGFGTAEDVSVSLQDWNTDCFSISGITYLQYLDPGEYIEFWVDFTPTSRGLKKTNVVAECSNSDYVHKSKLTGLGYGGVYKSVNAPHVSILFERIFDNHPILSQLFECIF